ncbi:MAG TPA: tryptophan synthase subunit alpha [Gammaproteobacteria bacterium]|nr:tryptophan synthase subunit alpha [Gammaproteobacteria bacterium]
MNDGRIERQFAKIKADGRGGLITFITAGDPNFDTSLALLKNLPDAGADIIELGMPFSDPMADGPTIQAANLRALHAGMTLRQTLELVRLFRVNNDHTPVVLMGYYNPIYHFGSEKFLHHAAATGVDALIIVDLPPEEDAELCDLAMPAGIRWIRLATPTTLGKRLPQVANKASGFLYYVSIAGITGTGSAQQQDIAAATKRLREHTRLPIGVGFGIKTPKQVANINRYADAAVVGSAIIDKIQENLDSRGNAQPGLVEQVTRFVASLAAPLRG